MKCEMCQKKDAETAITVTKDGAEEELYVCKKCAEAERVKRQKRSQRTRKVTGLPPGVTMTVTEVSALGDDGENGEEGEGVPPVVAAFMDAVNGMVGDLEKAAKGKTEGKAKKPPRMRTVSVEDVNPAFTLKAALHLEGLFLIGEVESTQRAMRAIGMSLEGFEADGIREAGHIYRLRYTGSSERAKKIRDEIVAQEKNARIRLFEQMLRIFGDSLCRALAILKNCRLLSPGELFDLLSPLRLAAQEQMLDGIKTEELEKLVSSISLASNEDKVDMDERDRLDAERADAMNRRFEDVVLNERAEGKFL